MVFRRKKFRKSTISNDNEINIETKVSVSTVQGLLKRTILSDEPDMMLGAFDLIIVDEAHRGYILDREMTEEEA